MIEAEKLTEVLFASATRYLSLTVRQFRIIIPGVFVPSYQAVGSVGPMLTSTRIPQDKVTGKNSNQITTEQPSFQDVM